MLTLIWMASWLRLTTKSMVTPVSRARVLLLVLLLRLTPNCLPPSSPSRASEQDREEGLDGH